MKFELTQTIKTVTIEESFGHPDLPSIYITRNTSNDKVGKFRLNGIGPHGSHPYLVKACNFNQTYSKIEEDIRFTNEVENLEFDEKDIIFMFNAGHIIFDYKGDPIPTLHRFDYIGTPFSNDVLDLEKAIKILKKHPWVMNKDELEILEIPYYNQSEDQTHYINVDILPDKETYKKLYKKTVKIGGYFSVTLKDYLHDGYCPTEDMNNLGLLECVIKKEED